MKKLKILFITSKFPQYKGDPQPAFTYYLAKELVQLGHEVYVIAPHSNNSKTEETIDKIKTYRFKYFWPSRFERLAYGAGIPANVSKSFLAKLQVPFMTITEILYVKKFLKSSKIFHRFQTGGQETEVGFTSGKFLGLRENQPKPKGRASHLFRTGGGRFSLEKVKPDIIHAHWAFPQGLAALFSGRKYITTIYGGEVFLSKKYKLIWLLDRIVKKSYKSFALTNGLRDIAKEFGVKSNIDVMPLGVDTNIFKKSNVGFKELKEKYCKNNELMVLSVGRLVEKKGMEYLIKAFKIVKDSLSNVKLVIVGDGYLYDSLVKLTDELGLQNDVFFTKEINHENLPKYYSAADLFVLPSIIDSIGDRETQGVVYLEAMASKLAVIGTNTGGVPDVISNENVGVLVPEKNHGRLAAAMLELLKDEKKRKAYADNGYKHVLKNFIWANIAKRYVRVYEECIKNESSSC